MPRYASTKAKLTKRLVDATTPEPDADVVVWDTEVPDFRLRVRPSGRKSYELRYQLPGSRTPRQIKIGDHGRPWTADEARDEAKKLLRQVYDGLDPLDKKAERRDAIAIDGLIDVYLAEGPAYKPDKRATSWEVDRYNLHHHLRPLLGKKLARDLTKDHLVVCKIRLPTARPLSVRSRRRSVALLTSEEDPARLRRQSGAWRPCWSGPESAAT